MRRLSDLAQDIAVVLIPRINFFHSLLKAAEVENFAVLIAEALVNYGLGKHLLAGDCHSPQHRIWLHDKSHPDAQRGVFWYGAHVSEKACGKNGVDVLLQLAAVGRASRLGADDSVNLAC